MEIDSDFSKMNIKSTEQSDASTPMDSEDSSRTQVVTHSVTNLFGFLENRVK